MTIKTKFSIGDVVYFMYENKIHSDKIEAIKTSLYSDTSGNIEYIMKNIYNRNYLEITEKENKLFATKDDLYQNLLNNIVDRTKESK
jgi:hypothetical protein